MFPSPFGVRVLKSEFGGGGHPGAAGVSVPFRGSCSEITIKKNNDIVSDSFRPLSGFVF